MYTIEWATNFNGFSEEVPLDLSELVIFLKKYVGDRIYLYETSNVKFPRFIIDFNSSQLLHLLGIQHIKNLPIK